jgi:superfamily II DNA or RNA helicase
MARSIQYDRAVGFFNSSIYIIAWPSLRDFVAGGGKMNIICSPHIPTEDAEAIKDGYAGKTDDDYGQKLKQEISRLLRDPNLQKPTRVLASLVANDIVRFKIAMFDDPNHARQSRLFHDKVGIFKDVNGNTVVFKGSMNETLAGLSLAGNLESVDVFVSWADERERERVNEEIEYFHSLWTNSYPTLSVREFPNVAYDELVRAADGIVWPDLVDEICDEIDAAVRLSADVQPDGHRLRPHQANALMAWMDQGRRGIFEHATGSGKTFSGLSAIRNAIQQSETPVILVPSELLLNQWKAEIELTLGDLSPQILVCGAGNDSWKKNRLLYLWSRPSNQPRLILSTMQTAASSEFLSNIQQGKHLFIVADEVHRVGSPIHRRVLSLESGPRLGLSATPRRFGDSGGTAAIFDYFGDVVPPPFGIQDAINAGTLSKYMYYPHTLILEEAEQKRYDAISERIRQLYAQFEESDRSDNHLRERIQRSLIQRARIVKAARQKVPKAVEILQEYYRQAEGQRWIVYCDSQQQLTSVLDAIRAIGLFADEYHSEMMGDKEQTLRNFEMNGGILVSIRCLDEGVNIPSVSHALILASSKNPREFIQRRGRVLRKAPGKHLAFIHDAIVLPRSSDTQIPVDATIIQGELARAIEFGQYAANPLAISSLREIAIRYDIDIDTVSDGGFEDDEER